jgi:hypothetical protein
MKNQVFWNMMLYCLAKVSKGLPWIILERPMMIKGAPFFKTVTLQTHSSTHPHLTSTIMPL